MRLLLQAALRNKKHFILSVLTLVSLLLLTVADQMERFSIGVLANKGTDFFVLFGKEGKNSVSFKDIEKKWNRIDKTGSGKITKLDANKYLAGRKDKNPLNMILNKVAAEFDLHKHFIYLIFVLIFVALFKAVVLFTSRYTTQILSIRINRDLRLQYFEHIQSLPLSFYYDYNLGALATRAVGDTSQISSSINSCLTNYIHTPFTIVTTLFMCFYISWKLSLVIFIGLPLIVFPVVFLTKRVKRVSKQMQKNQENFTSVLLDFLSGIQTIKIYAMELFSLKKFKKQNDRMAHLESKSAKYSLLTRPILHMITTTCLAFVIIVGLYVLQMTIAQLLVFCALLHLFYEPVKKFAEENANIQRGVVAAERMFEVLNLKPSIQDKEGAIDLKEFNHSIEFRNVSFRYKNEWVLKDLSFFLEKGKTLAIVGPTGAGKSTIVQLLPRLYDVQKGDILIDGISITNYTQKSLRESIGFVPQKPFLFYDTILENISFGRKFSEEQVIEASKKAFAHEFIVELPNRYNMLLAESGKNLSGGQQQRIAITRALLKNAPILVLDEATSSLDAISENRIKQALKQLKGMTQLIIAHRLSTIEHADKIIYLDKGRKIAEGTKDELLKTSGEFKEMWEEFHQLHKAKV